MFPCHDPGLARPLIDVIMFMNVLLGADRFYDNIEMMYGFRISPFMKAGWLFMAPGFCLVRLSHN